MAWLNAQQHTPVPLGKNGRVAASATEARLDEHQVLSMYASPPEGEVVIEEFERFAIARLRGEQRMRPYYAEHALCARMTD
jgi:hypothetical protein